MKKIIYLFITVLIFSSCEKLGLDPSSKLLGTWKHTNTGAAGGGSGSITYNGIKLVIPQVKNNASLNITFEKNGICESQEWDRYKTSKDILTFSRSTDNETAEYDYRIFEGGLTLWEKLSEYQKIDSKYTSIDVTYSFDKQ